MGAELRFSPRIETLIKGLAKRFGVGITSYTRLETLTSNARALDDLKFLLAQPDPSVARLLRLLAKSKSQFRQDLFALTELNFKQNGYFVEFGATNGIDLSNTYLLEKEFGWNGILAEPAIVWHEDLAKSRKCVIDKRCVWGSTGSKLQFREVGNADLSTVQSLAEADSYAALRRYGKTYEVETISLTDLLDQHQAPTVIDYLSLDTEGAELEILSKFDFSRYQFRVITCEHNYSNTRRPISQLLQQQGYIQKYPELSQFDDWFVRVETSHSSA